MEKDKRFYWLKLKRDFFKRHDIQIIESMPNGKDYILFYLKLLCESVDHEGNLRFSNEIPYNEEMLSVITKTNIDIVRNAINVFSKLNMMEVLDDGTYFMNEVSKMMGSETEWAEKKRLYREQKAQLGQCPSNVLPMSDKSKSIEIDKDIDIKENNILKEKTTKFQKPTLEELQAYINEKGYHFTAEAFIDHYESVGWKIGKNPMKNWKSACSTWERNYKENNPYSSKKENINETSYPEYRNKNYF